MSENDEVCKAFKVKDDMLDLALGYSKHTSFFIIIIPSITIFLNILYVISYFREKSSNKNSK